MSTSNKWAAAIGFLVVLILLGGGIARQRRHPGSTPVAFLDAAATKGDSRAFTSPSKAATPKTGVQPPTGASVASTGSAKAGPTPRSSVAPAPPVPTQAAGTTQTAGTTKTPEPKTPEPKTPDPMKTPEGPKPAPGGEPPRFDVVRVEPAGDTLVAGKGEPHAKVALLASGKAVAEAETDASGQFVLLPPPLAPGDYDLTIRQSADGKAETTSSQSVAVSVPKTAKGHVVVALAEPGQPTRVLSPPAASTSDAPASSLPSPVRDEAKTAAASARVAIRSVDLENGNGFHASGLAAPGQSVHVYLNDSHVADVVADTDGRWSLTIRKGLAAGHYSVRADTGPAGKPVVARVEVPFDVPPSMAVATRVSPGDSRSPPGPNPRGVGGPEVLPPAPIAAPRSRSAALASPPARADDEPAEAKGPHVQSDPKAAEASPTTALADPADASRAVIDEIFTHEVLDGDSLWRISRHELGFGHRFTQIYEANAEQIRDPDKIYPGQILVVPPK